MDHSLYTAQLTTLWKKVPQQQLTRFLLIGLLLYIALSLAKISWLFFPDAKQNRSSTNTVVAAQSAKSSHSIKIEEIQKLHLFGEYNKKQVIAPKVETITSAPQTRLKLVLTGLVASSSPKTAAAIIESQGKQDTYGIDDKIEGTRAVLKQVQLDRVIIETSGRLETLMLDGFEYTKKTKQQTKQATVKPNLKIKGAKIKNTKSTVSPESVAQLRAKIMADPAKLTDIVKISPHRLNGKVIGYRLMPNKDPALFKELGLVAGDIAVQINGSDLTDMKQAQQALVEMKTAEHVNLLVERDGELLDVSLGLK